MKETLEFWKRVERTDPDHTRRVEQRGGFTAIDAYYQIQNATAEWGPVGSAWWWDVDLQLIGGVEPGAVWLARVNLHTPLGEKPVTQYGCKSYFAREGKVDEDAPKKCITDGLTKCLSYLGFNADVFLGKFDDSKYVESVREEIRRERAKGDPKIAALSRQIEELAARAKGDEAPAYISTALAAMKVSALEDLDPAKLERWVQKLTEMAS